MLQFLTSSKRFSPCPQGNAGWDAARACPERSHCGGCAHDTCGTLVVGTSCVSMLLLAHSHLYIRISPLYAKATCCHCWHVCLSQHACVVQTVAAGDCVVDATCGKGRDAAKIASLVGSTGTLHAFDIQQTAVQETSDLLQRQQVCPRNLLRLIRY